MATRAKVKLPKSIQVSGLTWKVSARKNLRNCGEAVDGLCVPDSQSIQICAGILGHEDRTRKTLLHESLHAGLHAYPQYYDEHLITILEEKIDELIRVNPDFMRLYGYELIR